MTVRAPRSVRHNCSFLFNRTDAGYPRRYQYSTTIRSSTSVTPWLISSSLPWIAAWRSRCSQSCAYQGGYDDRTPFHNCSPPVHRAITTPRGVRRYQWTRKRAALANIRRQPEPDPAYRPMATGFRSPIRAEADGVMLSAASKMICWSGRGRSPLHTMAAVAVSG